MPVVSASLRTENGRLRFPLRLFWNDAERRPRAAVRILVAVLGVLVLANTARTYQPTLFPGTGPVADVWNTLSSGLPQSLAIAAGVCLAAVVLDRRRLTDLGFPLDGNGRRFVGGTALGASITAGSVGVGLLAGYYDLTGIRLTHGLGTWLLLLVGTISSQLGIVVAEELFARGYLITNVLEGLDGVPSLPRAATAAVAIGVAALFFVLTHSVRGTTFAVMAGGLAVLFGVAYVLTGDLTAPIGIHFGVNAAGMLCGTAPQPASLLELSAKSTVADSLVLPADAVVVRLLAAAGSVVVLLWWHASHSDHDWVTPALAQPTLRHHTDDTPDQPHD
ncbi:lysostaphin resistance A-like protein [Halobacterium hubeiense]|uniref:CPBP family intramembrane glutamic endopeptidase n=1 Tax=Halobacterium hubeiense TaxID=1407499 RepID=UPI003C7596E9